jgi:periplasmic copper chaperone A
MFRKSLIAAAFAVAAAGAAQAHVTLEASEAPVGATHKAVLRVPHGCEGAATTRVRLKIPEGVIAVKPMPKANWTLETVIGAYARAYDNHEIRWARVSPRSSGPASCPTPSTTSSSCARF